MRWLCEIVECTQKFVLRCFLEPIENFQLKFKYTGKILWIERFLPWMYVGKIVLTVDFRVKSFYFIFFKVHKIYLFLFLFLTYDFFFQKFKFQMTEHGQVSILNSLSVIYSRKLYSWKCQEASLSWDECAPFACTWPRPELLVSSSCHCLVFAVRMSACL